MCLVFVGLGIVRQTPIFIMIAGTFILFLSVTLTSIDMGSLATTLTDTTPSITEVDYTQDPFVFNFEIKFLFAMIGTFLIMTSMLFWKEANK